MQNLSSLLQNQVTEIIKKIFHTENICANITQSTQPQFGHYQCNSAMKLSRILGGNSRKIAEKIVQNWGAIKEKEGMIKNLEVAGAGFINITLTSSFLSKELTQIAVDKRLGVSPLSKKKRIIVEFSSPNIAKELHVGHLRSTIIGESLARLFEFLGHDVMRLNHIGDWGTQFGMLITYLKEREPDILSGRKETDLPSLMHWYRESKKLFNTDPAFKKRSQVQVINLQSGEKWAIDSWKKICAISRKGFQEVYDILDVKITERGESFYNSMLPQVVKDYERKGMITISDGAKCVFLEGFKNKDGTHLPMILQKSDGGYNYATTDSAAILHRVKEERADRIIYVVDAGQQLHFQMVFKAAERAGYYNPQKVQVEHVPFGVVLGADGKKFKTRSGETEKLIDLLKEAINRARLLLQKRILNITDQELDHLSHVLGIDAVKYADLSCHRVKDYLFSYDRMLKFEGNTAAYLLYSYVRVQGIKRKCNSTTTSTRSIELKHPSEIALGLKLRQFGEALLAMDQSLLPNRLSDYLYELAEKFHAFFRDCRVKGAPESKSRLALCELTANIVKQGLHILGLKIMDRM